MSEPTVTVVIGAYNAMPYLTRCLESVVEQSPGAYTLECLAVDDGSTDGTGKELDRFAAEHPGLVRVVHQQNSGGPSGPRNVALGLARGRYVFFLDADDHLGPHALRRMIDMAERNRSDVVLGKYVGVNCTVPASMFEADQEVVDLAASRVWYALTPHKLFRRSFLDERGLRFDEDVRIGEDRLFVTKAYLQASVISVVATEDCYYKVKRDDQGNITSSYSDLMKRFEVARRLMAAIAAHSEPGPVRDAALLRTFRGGLLDSFSWRFPLLDEGDRRKAMGIAKEQLDAFYTPELDAQMTAPHRLAAHCSRHGLHQELIEVIDFLKEERSGRGPAHEVVVDGGRAYATYPYFRDETAGIPDSCYDITDDLRQDDRLDAVEWRRIRRGGVLRLRGYGRIENVPTRQPATELVLRLRNDGREARVPVRPAPLPAATPDQAFDDALAGFTADVDLTRALDGAPLPTGIWDVYLNVRTQGLSTQRRFGARKADDLAAATGGRSGSLHVKPYYTQGYANLSLHITVAPKKEPGKWRPTRLERRVRGRLSGLGRRIGGRRLRGIVRRRRLSALGGPGRSPRP
ncbi:glycosyltransferase family 2 protein [Streptomyces sp. NBC_01275]|uniref:glycosyltransferase family 2 protein n=1 Tax=Streptomyces sp. NBC_01275 TaxID=2903807 RepID=UPI002252D6F4|nr:glycosyltransferase family 2 protein [Streptomyces sp. NBC_01275]MCX4765357.1 glycosyltransferase family 2 protein [Streptomyces sp. NBC_01275]